MKVYLAGGMHGDWRNKYFMDPAFQGDTFFDPKTHGLGYADEYTTWDLKAIEMCDVFVGFMENDNPSGIGLAVEVGYAKALGKTIIMVFETGFGLQDRSRYFEMIQVCADVVTDDHDYAAKFLSQIRKFYPPPTSQSI